MNDLAPAQQPPVEWGDIEEPRVPHRLFALKNRDTFLVADVRARLPGWQDERRFYFDPAWNRGRQVLINPCPGSVLRIDWQLDRDVERDARDVLPREAVGRRVRDHHVKHGDVVECLLGELGREDADRLERREPRSARPIPRSRRGALRKARRHTASESPITSKSSEPR